MEVTEIRIKLMEDPGERLKAFCSITFDNAFVIRDLKIIDGTNGPFVAMPSRKLTTRCHQCGCKNHLRAVYCNQCGKKQNSNWTPKDGQGRVKLYADIAHPINSDCREMIQAKLIEAFLDEVERSKQPDYVPSYYDFDDMDYDSPENVSSEPVNPSVENRPKVTARSDEAEQLPAGPHRFDGRRGIRCNGFRLA